MSRLIPDRRRAVRSSGQRGGDVWRWLCHGWRRDGPAAARLPRLLECLAPAPVPLALLLARREVPTGLNPEVASALGSLPGDPVAVGDAVAALGRSRTQADRDRPHMPQRGCS